MSAVTRIVKFVPTRRSIVKIEKLCSECKDKRRLYIGETARSVGERFKEHIKITNQKLKPNMNAVLYINIPLNTIMAGKLDINWLFLY